MLTGEIRNKVDKIWTDMWAGGISNPLTVIEQLTYLMFIRSLDEKELEAESFEVLTGEPLPKLFPQNPEGQALRWGQFKKKNMLSILWNVLINCTPSIVGIMPNALSVMMPMPNRVLMISNNRKKNPISSYLWI